MPILLVENGRTIERHMKRERVDPSDILAAARELQGLERLDQVRYAIPERNGSITIIPQASASS